MVNSNAAIAPLCAAHLLNEDAAPLPLLLPLLPLEVFLLLFLVVFLFPPALRFLSADFCLSACALAPCPLLLSFRPGILMGYKEELV